MVGVGPARARFEMKGGVAAGRAAAQRKASAAKRRRKSSGGANVSAASRGKALVDDSGGSDSSQSADEYAHHRRTSSASGRRRGAGAGAGAAAALLMKRSTPSRGGAARRDGRVPAGTGSSTDESERASSAAKRRHKASSGADPPKGGARRSSRRSRKSSAAEVVPAPREALPSPGARWSSQGWYRVVKGGWEQVVAREKMDVGADAIEWLHRSSSRPLDGNAPPEKRVALAGVYFEPREVTEADAAIEGECSVCGDSIQLSVEGTVFAANVAADGQPLVCLPCVGSSATNEAPNESERLAVELQHYREVQQATTEIAQTRANLIAGVTHVSDVVVTPIPGLIASPAFAALIQLRPVDAWTPPPPVYYGDLDGYAVPKTIESVSGDGAETNGAASTSGDGDRAAAETASSGAGAGAAAADESGATAPRDVTNQ